MNQPALTVTATRRRLTYRTVELTAGKEEAFKEPTWEPVSIDLEENERVVSAEADTLYRSGGTHAYHTPIVRLLIETTEQSA